MNDDERKAQVASSEGENISDQPVSTGAESPVSDTSDNHDETPVIEDAAVAPSGRDSLIDNFTAGGILRAARERQELSIAAVSSALHLNQRAIDCLERTMQPPGYDMSRTRIAARSYAKYLGIPPENVLADFPMDDNPKLATAVPRSSVAEVQPRRGSRVAIPAAVMACVVAAGAGIAFLMTPGDSVAGRSAPSVAERVVAVNTAQESLFARAPLASGQIDAPELSIIATRPEWIEVRGPDGTIFRSRTMARGEIYYPRVGADWTVTVRDGTAFEWRIDGRAIGNLSEIAAPVYSASIDEAAAVAAAQSQPTLASATNSRPSR